MSLVLEPSIDPSNVSRAIYLSLKKQILNLELLPSEKMSEVKVATMMQCSRTPVREAFHQLRAEGFLESRPQVGTFVPKIDMLRVEEVRFIRESIEIAVIKYGIKNRLFDKKSLDVLQKLIDKQEKVYAAKKYDEFNNLDMEFHGLFRKITNKECSKNYVGDEDINYARLRFMSVRYEPNWHIAIEHHQAILDAVKNSDVDQMEEAVSVHLHNLYEVLKNSDLNNPTYIINYDKIHI